MRSWTWILEIMVGFAAAGGLACGDDRPPPLGGDPLNGDGSAPSLDAKDERAPDLDATGPGTETLVVLPEADAYVWSASPAQSFGDTWELVIQREGAEAYVSYLRFDLSSVTSQVVGATLRFEPTLTSHDGIVNAAAFVADDGWDETKLTWNDRPTDGAVFASSVAVVGQPSELDATQHVIDELSGDRKLSVSLSFQSSPHGLGKTSFMSREEAAKEWVDNPPAELVLTVVAVDRGD